MSVEDIDFLKENCIKESIIVLVDSKDRDMRRYPHPGEFQVDFVEPFTFVYGIEILDTTIPRTMFMIEEGINSSFVYNCGNWYNIFSESSQQVVNFATQDFTSVDSFLNSITEQIQLYESLNGLNIASSNFELFFDFDTNPQARHTRANQNHPILRAYSKVPFFINASRSTSKEIFGFNSINFHSTENSLSLKSMLGNNKNKNVDMSNRTKVTEPSSTILFTSDMTKNIHSSTHVEAVVTSSSGLFTFEFTINRTGIHTFQLYMSDGSLFDISTLSLGDVSLLFNGGVIPITNVSMYTTFEALAVGVYMLQITNPFTIPPFLHVVMNTDMPQYNLRNKSWYTNSPSDVHEYTLEYVHTNISKSQSSIFNVEMSSLTVPFLLEINDNNGNTVILENDVDDPIVAYSKKISQSENTLYLFKFDHDQTYTLTLIAPDHFVDCAIGLLDFYDVSRYVDDELFISKPWINDTVIESLNPSAWSISITDRLIHYVKIRITSGTHDITGESCCLSLSDINSQFTVDIHMTVEFDTDLNQNVFIYRNDNSDENFITNLYTNHFQKRGVPIFSFVSDSATLSWDIYFGFKSFGRTDGSDRYFTVVSPGMLNLGNENYIILRCDEIEQHLRGSYYYNGFSPGLGVLNMTVQGFAESKNEFYAINYKEFHPIGRLSKMKFRFERKTDREIYNFRNVNLHFLMKIKYYRPHRNSVFKHSVLNPEYNPDYVGYINNTYRLEEPLSEEDEESENEFPNEFLRRENELMRDLMYDDE